jgi:hypothetical protein
MLLPGVVTSSNAGALLTSRSSTTRLSLKWALTWRLAASNDISFDPFQDATPDSHDAVLSCRVTAFGRTGSVQSFSPRAAGTVLQADGKLNRENSAVDSN